MLVSLPLAGLLLLLLASSSTATSAALHAATSWGVLVVIITETLSVPGWLTPWGLGLAWFSTDAAVVLMGPGAEFVLLQIHALWGGDRLDNLVQWSTFLGCILGVTVIARSLGAGRRGQVLAAVICATIPEGILGASGAKNDIGLDLSTQVGNQFEYPWLALLAATGPHGSGSWVLPTTRWCTAEARRHCNRAP
jgi:hypothetical protein